MITFDEAAGIIAANAKPLETESVPLEDADRRVLARDIVARFASPPHPVSAMDGYAVREADLACLPASLPVIGAAYAGTPFAGDLRPGSCVRIFTGAQLPTGADRVVIQEEVSHDGDVALFQAPLMPRRHIRAVGSDFQEGDVLLSAGIALNPQRLVAAAAANLAAVEVVRQPRVLIMACGDELAPPGSREMRPAAVTESLTPAIAALVRRWNGVVLGRWLCSDDLQSLQAAAAKAVKRADVVVVTGGASVGERDHAKAMFAPLGLRLLFNKVAIKPGKPVWFGETRGTLVMGLPGNPTSALVTARLLLAPLIAGLAGGDPASAWQWQQQRLATPIGPCHDREMFLRAACFAEGVASLPNQDSAAQRALADATLLIRRRAASAPAGIGALVDTLAF